MSTVNARVSTSFHQHIYVLRRLAFTSLTFTSSLSSLQLAMRNRPGRTKVDENATSRHARQPSTARLSQTMVNVQALKTGLAQPRAALGEVTTTAVNRNKVRLHSTSLLTYYKRSYPWY